MHITLLNKAKQEQRQRKKKAPELLQGLFHSLQPI
jgi:hypothetical protein